MLVTGFSQAKYMYQDGSNLHIAVLLSNHGVMCHAMTHDPAVIGHSEDIIVVADSRCSMK